MQQSFAGDIRERIRERARHSVIELSVVVVYSRRGLDFPWSKAQLDFIRLSVGSGGNFLSLSI